MIRNETHGDMHLPPGQPRGAALRGARRRGHEIRAHGWARAGEQGAATTFEPATPRRAAHFAGVPFLACLALAVLTLAGLARVHGRTKVLALGARISDLTEERSALLDRKQRLETERAFLRHPDRVMARATDELGMVPASPERIRRIELRGAETP
jgi:hypothetical protein